MFWKRRFSLTLVALAAIFVCVSCGGESPQKSKSAAQSKAPANIQLSPSQAGACSPGFTEVEMVPENFQEAWFADSLRVCSKPTTSSSAAYQLEIINAGPAVWMADHIRPPSPSFNMNDPLALQLFRHVGITSNLAVEPGQRYRAPVGSSFQPRLHLDLAAQAAWEAASRIADAAKQRIDAALKRSWLGTAVTCVQSGYQVGQRLVNAGEGVDLLDGVFTGVTATKECISAIKQEQALANSEHRAPALLEKDLRVAEITDETALANARKALTGGWKAGAKIARGLLK